MNISTPPIRRATALGVSIVSVVALSMGVGPTASADSAGRIVIREGRTYESLENI